MERPNVLFAVLILLGISLFTAGCYYFKSVWDENTFPKGTQEQGQVYIVEGEVHDSFSHNPNKYYNETNNITRLPIAYGENWETLYNVSGDIRGRFHSGELVLLSTEWNGSLGIASQTWSVEEYRPPHIAYSLTSFLPVLGVIILIVSVFLRKSGYGRQACIKTAICTIPSLAFIPGYFIGAALPDPCLSLFYILVSLLLLTILLFKGGLREYVSDGRPTRMVLTVVIVMILVMILAIPIGSLCAVRYIDWFP
jgi:hypothetical protein